MLCERFDVLGRVLDYISRHFSQIGAVQGGERGVGVERAAAGRTASFGWQACLSVCRAS